MRYSICHKISYISEVDCIVELKLFQIHVLLFIEIMLSVALLNKHPKGKLETISHRHLPHLNLNFTP